MLQYQCLNATIPLTCTLANEYPCINEISKKNGTVSGDCIACDALFSFIYLFFFSLLKKPIKWLRVIKREIVKLNFYEIV